MKTNSTTHRPKLGRPKAAPGLARPHRIVTFVTDKEREELQNIAREEDRSMAAVVYRIIKTHFEER